MSVFACNLLYNVLAIRIRTVAASLYLNFYIDDKFFISIAHRPGTDNVAVSYAALPMVRTLTQSLKFDTLCHQEINLMKTDLMTTSFRLQQRIQSLLPKPLPEKQYTKTLGIILTCESFKPQQIVTAQFEKAAGAARKIASFALEHAQIPKFVSMGCLSKLNWGAWLTTPTAQHFRQLESTIIANTDHFLSRFRSRQVWFALAADPILVHPATSRLVSILISLR